MERSLIFDTKDEVNNSIFDTKIYRETSVKQKTFSSGLKEHYASSGDLMLYRCQHKRAGSTTARISSIARGRIKEEGERGMGKALWRRKRAMEKQFGEDLFKVSRPS